MLKQVQHDIVITPSYIVITRSPLTGLGDEAISVGSVGDCHASLAMTDYGQGDIIKVPPYSVIPNSNTCHSELVSESPGFPRFTPLTNRVSRDTFLTGIPLLWH